jgi:hypothetical protein
VCRMEVLHYNKGREIFRPAERLVSSQESCASRSCTVQKTEYKIRNIYTHTHTFKIH